MFIRYNNLPAIVFTNDSLQADHKTVHNINNQVKLFQVKYPRALKISENILFFTKRTRISTAVLFIEIYFLVRCLYNDFFSNIVLFCTFFLLRIGVLCELDFTLAI